MAVSGMWEACRQPMRRFASSTSSRNRAAAYRKRFADEAAYVPVAATIKPDLDHLRGSSAAEAPKGLIDDDLDFAFIDGLADRGTTTPSASSSAPALPDSAGAALQAKLSRATSAGHVQELVAQAGNQMDPTHLSAALHRLAKFSPRSSRGQLGLQGSTDPVVEGLVDRLGRSGRLQDLNPQALCCTLWALARLQLAPPWLPELLKRCSEVTAACSGHQLATLLHSLARLEGAAPVHTSQQHLLEALHQELLRRQRFLGPGGTSALDTVLLADALQKLQVRDEQLFATLASAAAVHLRAGELGVREIRHLVTAYAAMGFADTQLTASACDWLAQRVAECDLDDLVALAFALSRTGGVGGAASSRFFDALAPQIIEREQQNLVTGRSAASLLFSFQQAGRLEAPLRASLCSAVERFPEGLNGQDIALMLPSLGEVAFQRPSLVQLLASRTIQLSSMLSPRQLARVICGFGDARAQNPKLWDTFCRESLRRATYFSTPDVVRVLAGFSIAGVQNEEVLRTFWGLAATKRTKLLAEETLALLQLWPQLDPGVQRHFPQMVPELVGNLRLRLERGAQSGWQVPPQFAAELFQWLPTSRHLSSGGKLEGRVLRAALRQLPRTVERSSSSEWDQLLSALTLLDIEVLTRARVEAQQQPALRAAIAQQVRPWLGEGHSYDFEAAARLAWRCAALGYDGAPIKELLRALLLASPVNSASSSLASTSASSSSSAAPSPSSSSSSAPSSPPIVATAAVAWSCAELRVHKRESLNVIEKIVKQRQPSTEASNGPEALAFLRLAWSCLALNGPAQATRQLIAPTTQLDSQQVTSSMAPSDLRPLQQLAYQAQQAEASVPAKWMPAFLRQGAGVHTALSVEQELSSLLQHMRVPHVVASAAVLPGGIYRVPIWFPEPKAVLDVDVQGDRLASGMMGGAAEVRRNQLRAAGLQVVSFESSSLSRSSRPQRLRNLASMLSELCPEASNWLSSSEAAAMLQREEAAADHDFEEDDEDDEPMDTRRRR